MTEKVERENVQIVIKKKLYEIQQNKPCKLWQTGKPVGSLVVFHRYYEIVKKEKCCKRVSCNSANSLCFDCVGKEMPCIQERYHLNETLFKNI